MDNLKKDFIPYKEALALKELGFDEPCIKYYWTDGIFTKTYEAPFNYNKRDNLISSPTFSQAFRWFRGKYGLEGIIAPRFHRYDSLCYIYETINIYTVPRNILNDNLFKGIFEMYYTYEEAELECLKKLIEIVKNK